ncbi:uncharacterized protein LOC124357999 [Homalodisca vitripennis]|uniref:uncharacterized protein LOC124355111 n=1 Tax=Homalodisca vitripennis TaxID=197043 RepID=UPI001EEB8508|nr:uncharacterized protein LOC124355111 [Homalodisca vitripennis]XP_046666162.1 uncharacterized protein LOC124357999 [Homalodisca vitripennis]
MDIKRRTLLIMEMAKVQTPDSSEPDHEPTLLETDQESTNIQQEHSYVCNDSPISHKPTQNEGENGVDLNEMLENNMPDLDTSYLDISKMEIVYDFPNISFDTSKSQEPSLTDSILDDGDSVQLSGAIEITDNIGRMMVENGTNHAPDDLNSFHIVPHLEMEEHEVRKRNTNFNIHKFFSGP